MNIEDLIRAVNPVRPADLEDALSQGAQHTLARVLQQDATPGVANGRAPRAHRSSVPPGLHSRHGPPAVRSRRRKLIVIGLAAVASGAAAAALVLAVPGLTGAPSPTVAPGPKAHSSATPSAPQYTSAQQVLQAAAANVTSAATSGQYWHMKLVSGIVFPGGTSAHPYDITLSTSYEDWLPSAGSGTGYVVDQVQGAVPATEADAAAWRAAGSPSSWNSGQDPRPATLSRGAIHWATQLVAQTAAGAPMVFHGPTTGTVGYVDNNSAPGGTAAYFRQLPTSEKALKAMLRKIAHRPGCDGPNSGCSPVDVFVMDEAIQLLGDPVSAPVKAADFKVIASLPGTRLLGATTDPLGRHGYGIVIGSPLLGSEDPGAGGFHPVESVIVDPASGTLLADESIGPMPASVRCFVVTSSGACDGSAYVGRSFQGQVDAYDAFVSEGWTDTVPSMPAGAKSYHEFVGPLIWNALGPGSNADRG